MPSKRLSFNHLSGDGPLALIYQASEATIKFYTSRVHTWKWTLATTFPAMYYLSEYTFIAEEFPFVLPLMIFPSVYYYYDSYKASK